MAEHNYSLKFANSCCRVGQYNYPLLQSKEIKLTILPLLPAKVVDKD